MDSARLDQLVAKVLKEELREDENSRKQGLEQFRDWILKNPDIRDCITDDNFLLPFLRHRKYSIPMAQNSLLNLLQFQQKYPGMNKNLDIEDPDINDVVTNGYVFCTPFRGVYNKSAQVFVIAKNLDVTKHTYQTSTRAILLTAHTSVRIESTQVLGVSIILDFGEVSPTYVAMFPVATVKAITKGIEKAMALRSKQWHIINLPPIANMLFKMVLSGFSEKMQSRFLFHNSLEELHKHVDPSVLPKEYGGTMPMSEMIGLWKKELAAHREVILAINNIKLVGDSFKNDLEPNDMGVPGLPGSFRQLGVD